MIEGLQIDVPTDELKEILGRLVKKHTDKAERYQARAAEMKDHGDYPNLQVSDDKSTVESFERREREHRSLASEFQFMQEHLAPGETYRLTHEDLRRIEIVGGNRLY